MFKHRIKSSYATLAADEIQRDIDRRGDGATGKCNSNRLGELAELQRMLLPDMFDRGMRRCRRPWRKSTELVHKVAESRDYFFF